VTKESGPHYVISIGVHEQPDSVAEDSLLEPTERERKRRARDVRGDPSKLSASGR
jgi:hypothetical protein